MACSHCFFFVVDGNLKFIYSFLSQLFLLHDNNRYLPIVIANTNSSLVSYRIFSKALLLFSCVTAAIQGDIVNRMLDLELTLKIF